MDYLFLWALLSHWVADFYLQSDRMALHKSESFVVLAHHVAVYTGTVTLMVVLMYLLLVSPIITTDRVATFFAVTFAAHFATDAITSRLNRELLRLNDRHNFFVMIGFDQFLHHAQLFFTLKWVVTGSVF